MKKKKKKVLVIKQKVVSHPIVEEPRHCLRCGDEMNSARLKLFPDAVLCGGCQSAEDLQYKRTIPRKWVANIGL
jgi:RNA polymerase-binding transcription factor DksA